MIHTLKGNWRDNTHEDLGGVRREKTACVVRYGAFGDMIMLSSILPILKEEGYRVCVNTEPRGRDILLHDPNVDEWLLQEKGQVEPTELNEYWDHISPMFDRFINLTGSVEGRCLASGPRAQMVGGEMKILPARPEYFLSYAERQEKYSMNYIEETHRIAGVRFEHRPQFHPSYDELRKARFTLDRIRNRGIDRVVLWVLTGSSGHKMYPLMDRAIAEIMLTKPKRTAIIFVGDEACQWLEAPWRDEPNVIRKSGKLSIRETMTLAKLADVVVGPETGVLNAVSMERNRKVVLLSHSSIENLTKHWVNTVSLHTDAPCYPCHQLHLSVRECPLDDETQMPVCTSIDPSQVVEAIMSRSRLRKTA